jgi:hypothetical protein
MSNKGPWIKSEDVLPIIEIGIREYDSEHAFAQAMGFRDARRFYAIRYEQNYVAFDVLDQMLVFLNLEYLFHFPSSEGGFEDLLVYQKDLALNRICPKCKQDDRRPDSDCGLCQARAATRERRLRQKRERKSPTNDENLKGAKGVLARDGAYK